MLLIVIYKKVLKVVLIEKNSIKTRTNYAQNSIETMDVLMVIVKINCINNGGIIMSKVQGNMKACLQPMPKILVSCRGTDGKNNALAVAYCCNCSYDPPMIMVGIVPSRYSYKIVKETGSFVVNIVSKEQKVMFDYLGSHSGRNEDKFSKLNINVDEAIKINAPLLADCPISIECKVVDSIVTGSHEMFVGKIEYVHVDKALVDEKGNINYSDIDLL